MEEWGHKPTVLVIIDNDIVRGHLEVTAVCLKGCGRCGVQRMKILMANGARRTRQGRAG